MTENPNQGGHHADYPTYGYAPPWRPARRSRKPMYIGLGLIGLVLIIVVGVLLFNATSPAESTATIIFRLMPTAGYRITDADLDETVQILQSRLNSSGVVPGTVEKLLPDMVSVRLYGATDVPALSDHLGAQGQLLFVLLPRATYGDVMASSSTAQLPAEGSTLDPELLKTAQFNGSELDPKGTSAAEDPTNPGYWLVNFAFAGDYANQFAIWSGQHINEFFAMVLDGKVLWVPYIKSPITGGKGQISGAFTASDAKWLVVLLSYGALPFPLRDLSHAAPPSASPSVPPSACATPMGELEASASASAAVASAGASAAASGVEAPPAASAVAAPASAPASIAAASASAAAASASASAAAAAASPSKSC